MKKQIPVDRNLREQQHELPHSFPFTFGKERIRDYDKNYFNCHWHPDLEFTLILSGSMDYQVNDTVIPLAAGQGMLVNANMLHTAKAHEGQDCIYYYVRVHPLLIYGYENSTIYEKYIAPLTETGQFPCLHLAADTTWQGEIMNLLFRAIQCYEDQEEGYELTINGLLGLLFGILTKNIYPALQDITPPKNDKDLFRLKQAIAFIEGSYQEKLSLETIAASCAISKSECCRLFRKIMKQSPVQYLLHYRIRQSLPMLLEAEKTILEIAVACGFSNSSYYSEIFRRVMGCSPREYRQAN